MKTKIDDNDISSLCTEAAQAGDMEQVGICEKALAGDEGARAECVRVIEATQAMSDCPACDAGIPVRVLHTVRDLESDRTFSMKCLGADCPLCKSIQLAEEARQTPLVDHCRSCGAEVDDRAGWKHCSGGGPDCGDYCPDCVNAFEEHSHGAVPLDPGTQGPADGADMNLNRLRPTEADKDNLELWLSGIVNDALRDATEAGLSIRSAVTIIDSLADSWADRDFLFGHERQKTGRG